MNFNLIGEPWIPVLWQGSGRVEHREVSLRELFASADQIRDLALNPVQRIAVMRLLLTISYAALDGPRDPPHWVRCPSEIPSKVPEYLDQWRDRFDLFGESPFLQVKHLEQTRNTPCTKLDIRLATGNNHTLFDHQDLSQPRRMEPKQLALNLLTYQCFSTGGLIGVAQWGFGKTDSSRSSTHAPCVEGAPLLTILRGGNLLQTIQYNLLPRDRLEEYLKSQQHTVGRPVWELDPPASRSEAAGQLARTFLGRLVPLTRAVLLEPDCTYCTLANGVEYPKLPAAFEPMATVLFDEKKKTYFYLRFQPGRHPWRDLHAVLTLGKAGARGSPWALQNIHILREMNPEAAVDLWIGGVTADRAKYLEVGEWVFSVSLRMFGGTALETYKKGIQHAEITEALLKKAVKQYCEELAVESDGFMHVARLRYWGLLDQNYQELLRISDHAENLSNWKKLCRRVARKSLLEACPAQTPRQVIAHAKAMKRLFAHENKKQKTVKKGVPA